MNIINRNKGFTLVEIIVSVAIFTFVMFISTGAIYSIFDANRKSGNSRSIIDNLNYTLESMTRTIRFGKNYHCNILSGLPSVPLDCASGSTSMAVTNTQVNINPIYYRLNGTTIERSLDAGATWQPLTGPDVTITSLVFRVYGSLPYSNGSDALQPQVIIVLGGYVGTKTNSRTTFTIETTVSQRLVDSL